MILLEMIVLNIMLRDELTQKSMKVKMVLDTPEHVDSEKLNRQISYRP
jgi:hypothetical protein